jgi:mRNA interferase RelE/StbE
MIVCVDKRFQKDLAVLRDKNLNKKVAACIEAAINAQQLSEIKNIKKLTGFEAYYRIRIGNYRIGLEVKENEIIFIRILHRKEIYRFFP